MLQDVFPILWDHLVACCCLYWFLNCISQILKLHFSVVARRISHKIAVLRCCKKMYFPYYRSIWWHAAACIGSSQKSCKVIKQKQKVQYQLENDSNCESYCTGRKKTRLQSLPSLPSDRCPGLLVAFILTSKRLLTAENAH